MRGIWAAVFAGMLSSDASASVARPMPSTKNTVESSVRMPAPTSAQRTTTGTLSAGWVRPEGQTEGAVAHRAEGAAAAAQAVARRVAGTSVPTMKKPGNGARQRRDECNRYGDDDAEGVQRRVSRGTGGRPHAAPVSSATPVSLPERAVLCVYLPILRALLRGGVPRLRALRRARPLPLFPRVVFGRDILPAIGGKPRRTQRGLSGSGIPSAIRRRADARLVPPVVL